MKKKYIIIGIIVVLILFISIVVVNMLSTTYNYKEITTSFLINYNKDKVNGIEVYRGDELYFIIHYEDKGEKYIGVLNNKQKLINNVLEKDLYNFKDDNRVIGYKNNRLIYEVKKETKDGFTYYYYDAQSGEFIKKIVLDK